MVSLSLTELICDSYSDKHKAAKAGQLVVVFAPPRLSIAVLIPVHIY